MKTKIKILFVISQMVIGGAEVLTLYLLQKLNKEKFEVHFAVFKSGGELSGYIPDYVKVYDLGKKTRWDYFKLCWKAARLISKLSPDIVYSRMWYATSVAGMAIMLNFKKVTFIANEEHNHKRDIPKWGMLGLLKGSFMTFFHKFPQKIIVPSNGVKLDICKSYGIMPDKVEVICNSVDISKVVAMSRDNESAINVPRDKPIIAALGRLIKRKGFDLLIKAFAKVNKSIDCRLVIIGKGDEYNNLNRIAMEEGVHDKITFAGYQENPYNLMASSDIFVASSLWEGFCNVIIEAMACGVPVISTDCPFGPNEIITDGVNGLLVPVNDVEAMAGAILKLLKDKSLRDCLAKSGRERAEDFRVEKMIADYEKVFEDNAFRG